MFDLYSRTKILEPCIALGGSLVWRSTDPMHMQREFPSSRGTLRHSEPKAKSHQIDTGLKCMTDVWLMYMTRWRIWPGDVLWPDDVYDWENTEWQIHCAVVHIDICVIIFLHRVIATNKALLVVFIYICTILGLHFTYLTCRWRIWPGNLYDQVTYITGHKNLK